MIYTFSMQILMNALGAFMTVMLMQTALTPLETIPVAVE